MARILTVAPEKAKGLRWLAVWIVRRRYGHVPGITQVLLPDLRAAARLGRPDGRVLGMASRLRVATFNVEHLDDKQGENPTLDQRIALLRPQLIRIDAEVLYLQEGWAQPDAGGELHLSALEELVANTKYDGSERARRGP